MIPTGEHAAHLPALYAEDIDCRQRDVLVGALAEPLRPRLADGGGMAGGNAASTSWLLLQKGAAGNSAFPFACKVAYAVAAATGTEESGPAQELDAEGAHIPAKHAIQCAMMRSMA